MQPGQAPNPQLAGALMLIAGLAIVVGIVTKQFVVIDVKDSRIEGHLGLLGGEVCGMGDSDYGGDGYGGDCKSMPVWDEGVDDDIKTARWVALLGGFAAAGIAAVAGVMAFSRNRLPGGLIHGVVGLAASAMTYVLIRALSDSPAMVSSSPGYSAFVGLGGLVMTSVVAQTALARALAGGGAGAAAAAYPPPPPVATAPCTRCGRPAQYVTQYQRWYCPSCQTYL
jgi:hypothetical protein